MSALHVAAIDSANEQNMQVVRRAKQCAWLMG